MSVDYSATISYGVKLTNDQVNKYREAMPEIFEEVTDNFSVYTDGYRGDPDLIVGVMLIEVGEGETVSASDLKIDEDLRNSVLDALDKLGITTEPEVLFSCVVS